MIAIESGRKLDQTTKSQYNNIEKSFHLKA